MVVMPVLSACRAGMRQELTRSPLSRTAQAPHSPSPQPSLVPVRCEVFAEDVEETLHRRDGEGLWGAVDGEGDLGHAVPRRGCRGRWVGSRSSVPPWDGVVKLVRAFEDVFGQQGDGVEGDAGGVFDGVEDGGGGAVHGEFADALGAAGAVDAGDFFEVDVDGREVGAGGHDVVGHLVVHHAAVLSRRIFRRERSRCPGRRRLRSGLWRGRGA